MDQQAFGIYTWGLPRWLLIPAEYAQVVDFTELLSLQILYQQAGLAQVWMSSPHHDPHPYSTVSSYFKMQFWLCTSLLKNHVANCGLKVYCPHRRWGLLYESSLSVISEYLSSYTILFWPPWTTCSSSRLLQFNAFPNFLSLKCPCSLLMPVHTLWTCTRVCHW